MQEEKIVQARLKLRERFLHKMQATPALSDSAPRGSGKVNRHGMPTVPPGQKVVKKWPVLDLGRQPKVSLQEWTLNLYGACHNPLSLTWEQFNALPQVEDISDFHCVTTWSKLDMRWRGVRFADLAALAEPAEEATHVMCYGSDGYSTNLSLEEALKLDVMLVHTWEDQPLSVEHGGPVRMITPQLYAWKGSKWICRIEFMLSDRAGFWEKNGYSNTAHPWRDDRYASPEAARQLSGQQALRNLLGWLAVTALGCALAWAVSAH